MPQIDGTPDHAAPALQTYGWAPKAIVATVLAGLVSTLIAVLNLVQADPALLGSLPPWAQTVLLALVPPALAALGTWSAGPGDVR